jgi:hypothetical protein
MSSIDHTWRIGSFADGQAVVLGSVATPSRFCEGQDQRPDAVDLRVGRFADGQAHRTDDVPVCGRFSSGQERETVRHAGRAKPNRSPLHAFAEGDS